MKLAAEEPIVAKLDLTRQDIVNLDSELTRCVAATIDPNTWPRMHMLQSLLREKLQELKSAEYMGPG